LTPGTFCQTFFFDILVVLKLDRDQISFSLVENALVAGQLAVPATRIAFKTFWPRHAQKSKLGFSTFEFFFPLSFISSFFFAAVIGHFPGFLGVKKDFRKSHRGGEFLPWSS